MSSRKYQLEKLMPSLSAAAQKNKDREIKARFYLIKAVVESKKDIKKTCESRGYSTDFFYKWSAKLLKFKTLESLASTSRAPKKSPNQTVKRTEKKVMKIKRANPFLGPKRVSFYLKKWYKITCPPSTVYNILKRNNLISKKYLKRRTKKHMKRYRRSLPGYLQLDIKYVPFKIEGKQYYQWSCVDHHSSWRLIRAYKNKASESLLEFLEELEKECPFAIMEIQTDNDTVFTDKFSAKGGLGVTGWHKLDQWCKKHDIVHRLIPVGVKELNGKVENTHKFDDQEFFSQNVFFELKDLQEKTKRHNRYWNETRATETLSWLTPEETVDRAYVKAVASMKYLLRLYPKPKMKRIQTASGYIMVEKKYKIPKPKKIKKKTMVDRYMQYVEWCEENPYTGIVPMTPMSKIFS